MALRSLLLAQALGAGSRQWCETPLWISFQISVVVGGVVAVLDGVPEDEFEALRAFFRHDTRVRRIGKSDSAGDEHDRRNDQSG